MKRLLILLALPALAGCPANVPEVTCDWEFPQDEGARVASTQGFLAQITVTGSFTTDELPAVWFYLDRPDGPVDEATTLLQAGIANEGDCTGGCPGGARVESVVAPGAHTLHALALTGTGDIACEITRDIVVNSPPTVGDIAFDPATPGTVDDVAVVVTPTDADGDEVDLSITWTGPDGTTLVNEVLTSITTAVGETWTVSVTARDDLESGTPAEATIEIGNTPPSAPTVAITPDPGRVDGALQCRVDTLDGLDPDGQELTVQWSWTVDGADAGIADALVPGSETAAGEEWACSAVVSDGVDTSEPGTASTTIVGDIDVSGTASLSTVDFLPGARQDQNAGDAGTVGSPGDLDGDGFAEIILTTNDLVCIGITCNGKGRGWLFNSDVILPAGIEDAAAELTAGEGLELFAPVAVGDLNRDGFDDAALPFASATQATQAGRSGVYVLFGQAAGFSGTIDLETDAVKIVNRAGEHMGLVPPCPVGDLDGDGFNELAIPSPFAEQGRGRLYVIWGFPGNWPSGLEVTDYQPRFLIEGAGAGQALASSCAGPVDVNNDGLHDVVVSAPSAAGQGQGRVMVFLSDGTRPEGSLSSATADALIDGTTTGAGGFGSALVGLGDHDGDGHGDFAIYGNGEDADDSQAGHVWIASGADLTSGSALSATDLPHSITGIGDQGFCGRMASADVDGDGLHDLVCGDVRSATASDMDPPQTAAMRVFLGGAALASDRGVTDADWTLEAEDNEHRIGSSIGGVPDRDGDLVDEILLGAPGNDSAADEAGGVYFIDPAE
jgi:FlaG/FlaF family flagellin (archaellin)